MDPEKLICSRPNPLAFDVYRQWHPSSREVTRIVGERWAGNPLAVSWVEPEDVGGMGLYLVSDAARYTNDLDYPRIAQN